VLHFAIVGSFSLRRASRSRAVADRLPPLAIGAAAGSVLLTTNAEPLAAAPTRPDLSATIGWIVPFWCSHGRPGGAGITAAGSVTTRPTGSSLGAVAVLFVPALVPIVG
jgi:hypothetical protein